MLTARHVAAMRAALLYWQEELCPHGDEVMLPYLEPSDVKPLTTDEIAALRQQLEASLRFAVYDPTRDRLDGPELFNDLAEARQAAGQILEQLTFI